MTAVLILSSDSNHLSQRCSLHIKTSSNHMGKIWRVGRMCQHLPASTLHQILQTMTTMRCRIVLEKNDIMLKQFWLFMVKIWPHLILLEYTVILAIDHHTNWHSMVNYKSISAEEHDKPDFQSNLNVPCNFFLDEVWACYSAFCHFS